MDIGSDRRLFARCLIAAVGGFAAYRLFFPDSNGTPMFVAAVGIYLALTARAGYADAVRS